VSWFKKCLNKAGLFRDGIGLKGDVELLLWDSEGKLKDYRLIENVVTNLGVAYVADQCSDGGKAAMNAMAIGKGTQAATGGKTALKTEVVRGKVKGTAAVQGTGANDHKFVFTETFAAGVGTAALQEAGIFNNTTAGGTMLCYLTYAVINKGTADTLTITWTLAVADA